MEKTLNGGKMRLGLQEIEKELKHSSKQSELEQAISQQNRIKFHADKSLESVQGEPLEKFKTFVHSILPSDKANITMNLLKFPIPTNELTDKVFTKLSKIFDGRNPAFNYEFKKPDERRDWESYRQDVLDEPNVWANKAWDYFKTEINCVMVVDMPKEADNSSKYPQPYFYFVPINAVKSYRVNDMTGNMDWIIYTNEDKLIVIDGETYRTFSLTKSGNIGTLLSESKHGLDYCPSRFFWSEPLSLSTPDVKESPLSKELSNLDWYLFKLLGKRHLENYASYPILSGYEEECDYSDKDGNTCSHGHLITQDGHYLTDEAGNIVECPLCHGKKELAGAGTFITIPIPDENQPDLRNPISILNIDSESLKYNTEEVDRLAEKIVAGCVGVDNSILNELSVTDKQVDASYESQDSVLGRIKKGFEIAQCFIDSTVCRLRYGESFISCSINYGTEFYTLTPEVLRKRYNDAKKGGATESELDALRQQMLETEYRHNPLMLRRMLILSDLEPFCHSTREECMEMFDKGLISREDMIVKANFSNYIRRFERENDNVIEFGKEMEYYKKIEDIYDKLLEYARKEEKVN